MGSPFQRQPPSYVVIACNVLSSLTLLGCLFFWVTYLRFPRLRSLTFQMILVIVSADTMLASATMFGPLGTLNMESKVDLNNDTKSENERDHYSSLVPTYCVIQGLMIHGSMLFSGMLYAYFSFHLWRLTSPKIVLGLLPLSSETYAFEWSLWLLFSLVTTMVVIASLFISNKGGIAGQFWCFTIDETFASPLLYALLHIPLSILVGLCNAVVYFSLRCRVNRLFQIDLGGNYQLTSSRRHYLRELVGGISTLIGIASTCLTPAWLNWILSDFGYIDFADTISWFIIGYLFRGALNFALFVFAIPMIRFHWNYAGCLPRMLVCWDHNTQERERRRSIRESDKYYMKLL